MSTQKAVALQEVGKPVVLITDRPVPQPGPDQILIEVTVTALNPHDQKSRDEGLLIWTPDLLPWTCATDIVGTVAALGSNAGGGRFAVGDKVMGFKNLTDSKGTQSGLQQYALADVEGTICKVPKGCSDDEAATVPTNLTTVFVAMCINMRIKVPWEEEGTVPKVLLIVGGGSNCGKFAVQLAKLVGIETIITIGGNEAELKGWGATHVLDRHQDAAEIVRQVKEITKDDLLYALDAVNGPTGLAPGFDSLSSKKQGILARLVPRDKIGDDVKRGHELTEVMSGGGARDPPSLNMWKRLPEWIEKGYIKPVSYAAAGGLTAEAVNEAMDKYRDGKSVGQPHIHVA